MKRISKVVALLASASLVTLFGGCDLFGDLDGDDGSSGPSAEASAESAVESGVELDGALDDPESDTTLAALNRLQGDLYNMTLSADSSTTTGGLSTARAALSADCVVQTADTITYQECGVDGATISGTVTVVGTTVSFNITMDADTSLYDQVNAAQGSGISININSVKVTESGSLTITPTSITGPVDVSVRTNITVSMTGVPDSTSDDTTNIQATYNVTLADGCAVGGTLVVVSSGTTQTATFGPNCGDVDVN